MKLKAKVNKLFGVKEPVSVKGDCDCTISNEPNQRMFKVTASISEENWNTDLQRYILVNPSNRSEVIISETKLFEFEVYNGWTARDILESAVFDNVKVETVK